MLFEKRKNFTKISHYFERNSFSVAKATPECCPLSMDIKSSMATMAMAMPTILFGHITGHFWP